MIGRSKPKNMQTCMEVSIPLWDDWKRIPAVSLFGYYLVSIPLWDDWKRLKRYE